jgi:hypothetical protein
LVEPHVDQRATVGSSHRPIRRQFCRLDDAGLGKDAWSLTGEFDAAGKTKSRRKTTDVGFDGALRHDQCIGDLLGRRPASEQPHDLALPGGQVKARRLLSDQPPDCAGRCDAPTIEKVSNRSKEILPGRFDRDDPIGASPEQVDFLGWI